MNNKLLLNTLFVSLLSFSMISCDKTTKENRPEGTYILQEDEVYTPYDVTFEDCSDLKKSSMSIQGVGSSLIVDPFDITCFNNSVTVRYPTASLLQGQIVVYTSAYYSRNTFLRSDDVYEYVLSRKDNKWYVDDIKNSSETFIPFNGLVISVPQNLSVSLDIGFEAKISNYDIPIYDLGVYNQKGNRIAIRSANTFTFNSVGVSLYNSNSLGEYSRSNWDKMATLNVLYDENKNEYFVDRFRALDKNGRVHTNINNGFCLASSISGSINSSNDEGFAILQSVRFNENDVINFESNGTIYNKQHSFSSSSINTVTLKDGSTRSFTIAKSTNNSTASRWGVEIAVSSSNIIMENGSHVNIPTNGYKLVLTCKNDTTGEKLNHLLADYFPIGSYVKINSGNIVIDVSSQVRVDGLLLKTSLLYEEINSAIKDENYSYDLNSLQECKSKLEFINKEVNSYLFKEDPSSLYYIYKLLGDTYQIYYKLISLSNRNEAVEVKAAWYINDYSNADYSLKSLVNNLTRIKESGLNELIVNVMEDGKVNYLNSSYFALDNKVSSKNYGEYNNNFLKAFCEEAHKLNIKVFANFTPFTIGLEKAFTELNDAFALNIDGKNQVVTSQGLVKMLDPSNPLFIEKAKIAVNDILANNPYLDGLHLDYIRFGADNNSINTVMGVTETARVGFNSWAIENKYSYNYSSLNDLKAALRNNKNVFSLFNVYQQDLITNTVSIIKDECKKYDVPLTAAVADDYNYVKTWKCQDWGKWAKLCIIDGLYLMDYYFDEYYVNYYFEDMLSNSNNQALLVTGIDPSYANLMDEFYAKTIKGAISNPNSHGYSIFGTHTQNANMSSWGLIKPSNWIDSLSPYDNLNKTIKAMGDLLLSRCDSIYIENNNQTQSQKEELRKDLESLYKLINENEDYDMAINVINKLQEMSNKQYGSNKANVRINEQINYMIKIAKLKANIYKV